MKDKLKKSILYNSIGSIIYLFCQWIITFIVVWIAGYETAGILSLAMTVSTTYTVIASFNMRNYQSSDIKNRFSEKTYIITRIITCLIALILTVLYSLIKKFTVYQILCITVYMIFKISEAFVDVFHGSLQKKWKFEKIGLSFIIRGISTLLSFTLALIITKDIFCSITLMTIMSYIIIYLYDIKNYKKEYTKFGKVNTKKIINLIMICIPLVIYGFLFNYVSMYPKVTLEKIYGAKMLGYYSTVATPAVIIQSLCLSIFSPMTTYFAEIYEKKEYKTLKKTMFKTIFLILIIGIIGYVLSKLFANFLFTLLFGKEISQYTYLFSGIIIISTLTAIIWFLSTILTVIRDYYNLIIGSFVSLALSLLLANSLIEKYVLLGVNYVLLIAYFSQITIYLISICKLRKENYKSSIIYVRSTSIINDSRATKEIDSLISNNRDVYIIGWDRDSKISNYKKVMINDKQINSKFFKFRSAYGSSLKNIIGLILFQFWLLFILIKNHKKFKYIHACDFDCGFVSYLVCKMYNKKLVYDIYDYYIESRPLPKSIEKIIEKLENIVINSADIVIICGEWRKKQINNTKPKKLEVIHNTPNINHISNNKIIKTKTKKLKIVYVGILQEHRLIMEIVNEIAKNKNYELHIGGFGIYEKEIERISKENENIIYYGSLKYSDVLSLERDCDILLATYDPKVRNHKFSAPNKVYEAMALGKPIIVCKNTGISEIVEKNNIGFSIKYDEKVLIRQLEKITEDKQLIKQMSKRANEIYKAKYNWYIMEEKLIKIYNELDNIGDNNEKN